MKRLGFGTSVCTRSYGPIILLLIRPLRRPPFRMVYMDDVMILVEINSLTRRWLNFDNNLNKEGLNNSTDLIEEIRRMAHVWEVAAEQRMTMMFNTRVRPRSFQEGDLVLKRVTDANKKGNLGPNWEGPYCRSWTMMLISLRVWKEWEYQGLGM